MKKTAFYATLILQTFISAFLLSTTVCAEDLEMINRPVNISGLTGLLFTTSPFVMPHRTMEVATSVLSENSAKPDYTFTEYDATISRGIGHNVEIAVKAAYLNRNDKAGSFKERGAGDAELSYKWNFKQQREYSAMPAAALIVTGIVPPGDKDAGLNNVQHWGGRIGLSIGSEIIMGDHVLGVYADAQVAFQDLSDNRYRDRYYIENAGLLVPISKYRNLQMFIEYNLVNGKDRLTVDGLDYSAMTYGLRLVSERFNLTIGTQFVHKKAEGYDDTSKVIGMMSMKF